MTNPEILVKGAGVAGLVTAVTLAERGAAVTLIERGSRVGSGASWMAGGMLAPWCEAESAPPEVTEQSVTSLAWWRDHVPDVTSNGSLVVAPPRDVGEVARFARRTSHFREVGAVEIGTLEPDLGGRFQKALFFPEEGHVDPRRALEHLQARLIALGGTVRLGVGDDQAEAKSCVETRLDAPVAAPVSMARNGTPETDAAFDWVVDCTGLDARMRVTSLRGVRGEMLLLHCPDVTLHRPIRLLHPRIPIYIVPRADHLFMVGATMIESENAGGMTLRSMSELLNAAWVLHPGFAEAEILEMGAGLRPSYPDNMPVVRQDGRRIFVNGMYRHGFLLSPAKAAEVAHIVFG